MADSPSHRFGQIIGDMLEAALIPLLSDIAQRHDLFLDSKGIRPARKGTKVSWRDIFGNTHDLDFVLERGGSSTKSGEPVAFIETAWRRYTKHSKNKAQEIESAILPLVTTHRNFAPFTGVILAGEFTNNSLDQLRSRDFTVLHFPYSTVVSAFKEVNIDAFFTEETPDAEFAVRVGAWESLNAGGRETVAVSLLEKNAVAVKQFVDRLESCLTRQISNIIILPLHGVELSFDAVETAIDFINTYDHPNDSYPIVKYEIGIRYNNGNRIDGQFSDKESATTFLKAYQPPPIEIVK